MYVHAEQVASIKLIRARQNDQSTTTVTKYFSQPVVKERACEQTVLARSHDQNNDFSVSATRRAVLVGRSLSVTRL